MPGGKVYKVYNPKKGLNKVENEQVNRKIKRMIANRQEKKIHTVDVSGSISTTVAFNLCTGIAQGDTDLTRDGDELYLKSLHWNWAFVGADSTNRMRLIVLQWHGDSAANPPAATDIFQVNTTTGHFGALRKDQKAMYTVLYDKQISTHTYKMIQLGKRNIYKGFRKKVQYSGGTTSGINQIYTCLVSDSSATSHPAIDSQFCVRFTDS